MIPILLLAAEAFARAGGGHSFGGGGGGGGFHSSGGYSGGGSNFHVGGSYSGGGNGNGGFLLWWLFFEHPEIGIPLALFVIFLKVYGARAGAQERTVVRSRPVVSRALNLAPLLAADAQFSRALFLDLARLVFIRTHEERGRGNWDALAPFLSDAGRKTLTGLGGQIKEIRDVVIGSARISALEMDRRTTIVVAFTANLTENGNQRYVEETWRFTRDNGAQSLGPDRMRTLGCPNCGNPIETRTDGSCRACDTVVNDGRLQWQVTGVHRGAVRTVEAIELALGGSGIEEGTDLPTLADPGLASAQRALRARHPEFVWTAFRTRAAETFLKIQEAWSTGRWETARPYETDFLFQQHRYWIERYAREGLTNRLSDVGINDVVPARVELDAHCESITVRIFARMKDWTEDRNGKVVSGDPKNSRVFSEYWTFVRSAGRKGKDTPIDNCPSCGAALDRISETGVCGYCEAKVTGGDFDWVLTTIDQDEVYRG